MNPEGAPTLVRFGAFEFDRKHGELARSGRRVHLAPQASRILDLLISRAGDIVTRDEICRAIWGDDTFVDFEAAVNTAISQIRTALGDKVTSARFLETVPRKGYRFVAPIVLPVDSVNVPDPASAPTTEVSSAPVQPPPPAKGNPSISWSLVAAAVLVFAGATAWLTVRAVEHPRVAVLPIEAPAAEVDLAALGSLLQERTLVHLHRIAGEKLVVISKPGVEHARGSQRTPETLRAADVAFFVDATLQRVENGRVRLHAKVARTSDLRILWATDYEFPETVFVEQRTALAQELAQELMAASSGIHAAGQSASAEIADVILSAATDIRQDSPGDVQRAIGKLSFALERERGNGRAHALLALANAKAAFLSPGPNNAERWDRARIESALALETRPDDPDAAAALGAVHLFFVNDMLGAGHHLKRAAVHARAPVEAHAWLSMWLSASGDHNGAISEARHVERIKPVRDASATLAGALYLARRFDEAREAAARVLAIHPESRDALTWLWLAQAASNAPQELDTLTRLTRLVGATFDSADALSPADWIRRRQRLLLLYRAALEREYESGDRTSPLQIGVAAALMNDVPAAKAWFDRAAQDRAPLAVLAGVHPVVSSLSIFRD